MNHQVSAVQDRQHDAAIRDAIHAAVPAVSAIYRFGSSVTADARPDSDVDVALLAAQPLDPVAPGSKTSSTARTHDSTKSGARFWSACDPKVPCMADDVHDYQRLNLDVVRSIVATRLDDFLAFARVLLTR